MRPTKLDDNTVAAELKKISGWSYSEGSLRKSLSFPDFSTAFAFMVKVALKAEKMNHHPDWRNVYNKVEITLSTHDAGGVTDLDIKLATYIDSLNK